jgi:hypothetical protein
MGIDGINRPGAGSGGAIEDVAAIEDGSVNENRAIKENSPVAQSGGTSETERAGGGFKERLEALRDASASGKASEALQRLDAGVISLEEYLELQVTEAVSHLEGKLPADQLDFVRDSLKSQLAEDPVLVELVRRTTGSSTTGSSGPSL